MTGVIYGLCDPDTLELRYVGKTTIPTPDRLSQHIQKSEREQGQYLHSWIRQLTRRGTKPSLLVLERDPIDLDEAERRWIREMRATGARLCNLTDGGDGGATFTGKKHTPEAIEKIRTRSHPPHQRQHMSESLKGRSLTSSHREAIGKALAGRKLSQRQRDALLKANLGRVISPETRAKIGAANRGRKRKRAM